MARNNTIQYNSYEIGTEKDLKYFPNCLLQKSECPLQVRVDLSRFEDHD